MMSGHFAGLPEAPRHHLQRTCAVTFLVFRVIANNTLLKRNNQLIRRQIIGIGTKSTAQRTRRPTPHRQTNPRPMTFGAAFRRQRSDFATSSPRSAKRTYNVQVTRLIHIRYIRRRSYESCNHRWRCRRCQRSSTSASPVASTTIPAS